jgi:phosphate transport system ATP-binding protein
MADAESGEKIRIEKLSFFYEDGTQAQPAEALATWGFQALKDITLSIKEKELFVLFGPARGGKTTLLRLLNRLSDELAGARHEGDVYLDGQNIFDPRVDVINLRRRVSMVFAVPTPLPGSIRANMTYGLRMAGMRDQDEMERRVERALTQAALWDEVKDRLDTSAFALSGGQKQRLCLARSLALEPEVILLDNPTSGLDPISTNIVEDSLAQLKQEYTVIMVPHSVQQAARVADRAGFLLSGELVEVGDSRLFVAPQDERTENYVEGRFG